MKKLEKTLWFSFFVALICHSILWLGLRHTQARWINVPPVPSEFSALVSSLGDPQLAYRSAGVMLQNLGDHGGQTRSLKEYNYDELVKWFYLADSLDASSDYIPYIASYYFGAIDKEKDKIRPLVDYLYEVGNRPEGQKWRWLAHAVYIARFRIDDLDLAYSMAIDLARLANKKDSKLPNWARQMPAFILNAQGEKEAALAIMIEILGSVGDQLHPNEVNHTRWYICDEILSPEERETNPLCEKPY